jgi:hypothetical protein
MLFSVAADSADSSFPLFINIHHQLPECEQLLLPLSLLSDVFKLNYYTG